jgi:UDP-N-acetylmuramoyl-tripeptide--D-alanyl-D-alanine ligase
MMTLGEAATAVCGQCTGEDVLFTGVSTDSRSIAPGALFVALRGERHDGHAFLEGAKAAGAVAALVDQASRMNAVPASLPLLIVPHTLQALGTLAAFWRARCHLPLIGVVGSNGKTTVKEMIAAIMRAHFGAAHTLATEGNLNNDIGVPLSLLKLRPAHRAAVIEIGMNHPGETAHLAAMARPTIGLVNNAQREHQEFMNSVEEVAAEHAQLIRALPAGGVAVLNADDAFAPLWRDAASSAGATVRDFGLEHPACVRGRYAVKGFSSEIRLQGPEGEASFTLAMPGAHNACNAAGAAAAATAAGASFASVERGLSGFSGVKGRQQRKTGRGGAVVIDDSYNANPESVRAAIDVLSGCAGMTVLILGDMGEVGERGPEFHREMGAYASHVHVTALFGLGALARHAVEAFGEQGKQAASLDELLAHARPWDRPGSTILVKGSRFMRMERVVDALVRDPREGGTH